MAASLDKPSLLFVIGIPVLGVLVVIAIAWLVYLGMGRVLHE